MTMSRTTSTDNLDRVGLGRLNLLFALLFLAMVGMTVRLATLVRRGQGVAAEYVQRQQRVVLPIPARPGGIWGCSRSTFRLLAGSRQSPGCFVDPAIIDDEDLEPVVQELSRTLGLDIAEVRETIFSRRDRRFVWIKKDLTEAEVVAVRELGRMPVGVSYEWRRQYPNGPVGATVLGYRRIDGKPGAGVELSQQGHLAAIDGKEVAVADAKRRPVWLTAATQSPQDGHDVYLTIDVAVQSYLEQAVGESVEQFGAQWGTGVVIEPATGRILAMCSAPSFDPRAYGQATPAQRTNRAVSCPYEPGSVAKPLFAAAAVDAGLVSYDTLIDCEDGVYRAHRGGRITDHGKSYGMMSLMDIIVYSSNIGMAKIGEIMGNDRLHAAADRYGFGRRTGIGLPGESPGIIRPLRKWDTYSLRRVPFGQEMSATALQLAMAFGSLANGGLLLEPQLIDHVRDADGNVAWQGQRQIVQRVLRPETAWAALAGLEEVVVRGTGKKCQLEQWRTFGKTGTAQIPGPGGYVDGAYTGTFVGGGPTSSPRVICVISIYWPERSKGYYGATVAAPYVRRVLQQTLTYLDVPADKGASHVVAGR